MKKYDKEYQKQIFELFESANYIAVDASGTAYAYYQAPSVFSLGWSAGGGLCWALPKVDTQGMDWSRTLVSREDVFPKPRYFVAVDDLNAIGRPSDVPIIEAKGSNADCCATDPRWVEIPSGTLPEYLERPSTDWVFGIPEEGQAFFMVGHGLKKNGIGTGHDTVTEPRYFQDMRWCLKEGEWVYCDVLEEVGNHGMWMVDVSKVPHLDSYQSTLYTCFGKKGFGGVQYEGMPGDGWSKNSFNLIRTGGIERPAVPKRVRFWVEKKHA